METWLLHIIVSAQMGANKPCGDGCRRREREGGKSLSICRKSRACITLSSRPRETRDGPASLVLSSWFPQVYRGEADRTLYQTLCLPPRCPPLSCSSFLSSPKLLASLMFHDATVRFSCFQTDLPLVLWIRESRNYFLQLLFFHFCRWWGGGGEKKRGKIREWGN